MTDNPTVDVCLQVFGKPWQTALTLLTLDRYMRQKINKIFFIIEASQPKSDNSVLPLLDGIIPNMESIYLKAWLGLDAIDESRMEDNEYRRNIRYQYAYEYTDADYLMLSHNDVIYKRDVILPFLNNIGDRIAIGEIGQCWNCPAKKEDIIKIFNQDGIDQSCSREDYENFKLDFEQLNLAYKIARAKAYPLRHEAEKCLTEEYKINPWPLPECRVNEWCCLINMRMARKITVPQGKGRPFGAYLKGQDLGTAWFRDMHHQGFRAKHMDLSKYIIHRPGHKALFNHKLYKENEIRAVQIIKKSFPEAYERLKSRGLS